MKTGPGRWTKLATICRTLGNERFDREETAGRIGKRAYSGQPNGGAILAVQDAAGYVTAPVSKRESLRRTKTL